MVSSAPDSEQMITFGSFSLLGIALRSRLLGVVVTPRILEKELE